MRVFYISDLHLEFFSFIPKIRNYKTVNKILILAGDIYTKECNLEIVNGFFEHITKVFGEENIYYVPGNHEYYGTNITNFNMNATRFNINNIVGCTLWSDFENNNTISKLNGVRKINDYKSIKNFSPDKQIELFKNDFNFLKKNINKNSIVVTHYLPSFKCINKQYKDSCVNGAFASNLDNFILEKEPKVWFHGHTHCPVDTNIGRTRILANPFGYLNKERNMTSHDYLPLKFIDV